MRKSERLRATDPKGSGPKQVKKRGPKKDGTGPNKDYPLKKKKGGK
jgi:hypothetical protein